MCGGEPVRALRYDEHVRRMTATELKAKLSDVFDEVDAGEVIEITRHGVTVARIEPARRHIALKGMFKGVVWSTASDEELFGTGVTWDLP